MGRGKSIHIISNVDEETKTADCAFCGRVRVRFRSNGPGRKRKWVCVVGMKQSDGAKCKTGVPLNRMTKEELIYYINNSHGQCEICGRKTHRILNRDHCHSTGKLRGLLCHRCNTVIGTSKENVDAIREKSALLLKIADYIEKHKSF